MREELSKTSSLCPECLQQLPAAVFSEQGKVWIEKECRQHGYFRELYWGDSEMYKKAQRFSEEGKGLLNPNVKEGKIKCPESCGLCPMHKTNSSLTNLVLTNRCDLNCWYCFFYAQKAGYVYEPTIEQIKSMLQRIRDERPVPGNAVQLTGGEPTLREDLIEIIEVCKEIGFDHVQLNTDGIRISQDAELVKKISNAGVNTLYLSFDGVTEKTNPKNHWEIPNALKNCRENDLGIVLVPTIIKTINDNEVGDIVRFGFNNIDVVRGINFQPVSLVGRMEQKQREKFRITIPDVIHAMEEQTNGEITTDDFYPVPTVVPIAQFIEHLRKKPQYELSAHFACGMATYLFKDGNRMAPITRFLDVDGFIEFLNQQKEELRKGKSKYVVGAKSLFKLNSFIDKKRLPKDLNLGKIMLDVFLKHDYRSLGVFHHKSMFIGLMHFMDLYNYDIERVKSCAVHYVTPDPAHPIVPFCAFNVIPEWYRDKIQSQFGMPIKEWEKKNGRKLSGDLYKRGLRKMQEAMKEKQLATVSAI